MTFSRLIAVVLFWLVKGVFTSVLIIFLPDQELLRLVKVIPSRVPGG